jgi:hypothetical protein
VSIRRRSITNRVALTMRSRISLIRGFHKLWDTKSVSSPQRKQGFEVAPLLCAAGW